jgi:colanic acid/amylovoran biosynthesis glycosyltransferase
MSVTVAHSFPVWLPQTQTWLYNQVRFLPPQATSHIICKEVQHLDQFGLPNIHALSGTSSRYSRISTRLFRHLDYHLFVRHMCRRLAPDILHSHFGPVGWKNHLVLRLPPASIPDRIKRVVTFYGQDVDHLPQSNPAWRNRYRDMFGRTDLVLCEGSVMASKVEALGCPPERIRVHHLGVDLDSLPYSPRAARGGEPFRVLMAAAFRPKKGFLYGLRALEQVSQRFDIEVTLVGDATGDGVSVREKQKILDFLNNSSLGKLTRLTGFMTARQLYDEARSHQIYLAPSITADDGDNEGGVPVSLIEMAATGMPVVSSRHCDIPEVVIDGRTGLLADERDAEGLATCLSQLMSHPGSWEAMTRNAREHIEAQYNAAIQGERLYKLYELL